MTERNFRILITDTLAESGLAILQAASEAEIDYRPGLTGDALYEAVASADALITRSGTAVTPKLLDAGEKLRVVGRAGVGLDNVDVDAATERGILIINAPTANIVSATEHTMALLLAVCRNLPAADASIRAGEWQRSKFTGIELSGKTIGIIGFGRIGSGVARRVRTFGMRILAFDPYISPAVPQKLGAETASLDTLLEESDFITVHTPLTEETHGMIGRDEFAKMRDRVVLINCARGGIYDETALADALRSGKVAAAGIDVFEDEPIPPGHPFLSLPNTVLTPHLGANTVEAQDRVAVQTVEMVLEALRGSIFVSAVNLPFEGLAGESAAPLIDLAERLGCLAAQLHQKPISGASIELWGIDERLTKILRIAALKGLLAPHLSESINFVNAGSIAETRGIEFRATIHATPADYTNLIRLCIDAEGNGRPELSVSGTLFSERNPRIVSVNDFLVEFKPERNVLFMINEDVPGVIGKVGTVLGDREINIAEYNLARSNAGGEAMAVVTIDSPIDDATIEFLRSFREMKEVRLIRF